MQYGLKAITLGRDMMTISPLLFGLFIACSDTETDNNNGRIQAPEKPLLITTSFPVDYLTRRLIGDQATINCINPVGEDPPEYNPPAEVIVKLNEADLIIQNGAGFEKWMETASLPTGKLVNSAQGISFITLEGETHSHGKKGSHSHAGIDPHIWSDPTRYAAQAQTIADRLITIMPERKDSINDELKTLKDELSTLDSKLATATQQLKGLQMSANHPAFNYMAEVTGLTIHAFDFDPETPPNESERMQWTVWKEKSQGTLLLWESQPLPKVAAAFEGAKHIILDPLEQPLENAKYDYMMQMLYNVEQFQALSDGLSNKLKEEKKDNAQQ